MLFQLFSDIHLELNPDENFTLPVKADYLFLAGDIGNIKKQNYHNFLQYCSDNWKQVFYVPGNHEFYNKRSMESNIERMTELVNKFKNVHLLINNYAQIDNYTIYGFVGWTYPIFKTSNAAKEYLNDYHNIKTRVGKFSICYHQTLASDGIQKFKTFISAANLDDQIKNLIILTHFPPNQLGTSDPKYTPNHLINYYAWKNLMQSEKIQTNKIRIFLINWK